MWLFAAMVIAATWIAIGLAVRALFGALFG